MITHGSAVHAAIARRFDPPQWATFFEVRNDAGFDGRRTADAVAMNTWPGRGLSVEGIEVKISRSDWLREMRDPAKSEPVLRFCNRWWLATYDDTIAKIEEIPDNWGLLVLRGKALVQVKKAPSLKPVPLDRGFVAMLLRSATKGFVPQSRVDEIVQEKLEAHVKSHRSSADWQMERNATELRSLRERVEAFEKASGVEITQRYNYGDLADPSKLGAAVRAILSGSTKGMPGHLVQAKNLVTAVAKDLQDTIDALAACRPPELRENTEGTVQDG